MKSNLLKKLLFGLTLLIALGASAQKIVGYMPSWAGTASSIQYDKLTHINYSFAIPNTNGKLKPLENTAKLQQIVSYAHANNVKVLIAVGGYSESGVTLDSRFEGIGANPTYRTNLVNDIVSLVQQYNLDGADMDWEFPDAGASANNFQALMTELYNALHPMGKLVSAAVNTSQYYEGGINPGVKNVVDYLNLMAYDANNSNHATYQFALQALNTYEGKGFARNQLVLGVPFYARPSWSSFASLVASGANPNLDSFNGNYYNGKTTIQTKSQYVKDNNYGGIMIWELSQDATGQNSLLTTIYNVIGGSQVQNQNPTVSVTSPVNNATLNEGNNVVITASAVDSDGSVTQVAFYINGVKVSDDNSAPYRYALSNASAGAYTVYAIAKDDDNATTTSSTVNFTVNSVIQNQAPSVAITSPSNGVSYGQGEVVSVSVNASDADGTVSNVKLWVDGTIFATDNSAPYVFTLNNLSVGVHTLSAVATDNDNSTNTSSTVSVSIEAVITGDCNEPSYIAGTPYNTGDLVENNGVIYECTVAGWCSSSAGWAYEPGNGTAWGSAWTEEDICNGNKVNQAPNVVITSPSNGIEFNEGENVTISVNASDVDGSVSKVEFYVDGQKVGQDATAPYRMTLTSLAVGVHTVYAAVVDNENATATSSSVSIIVNSVSNTNQTPNVSIAAPNDNAQFNEGDNITVSANAWDVDGSVSKVEFYIDGQKVGQDVNAPFTFVATGLVVGSYEIYVIATDDDLATAMSSVVGVEVNTVSSGGCGSYTEWSASATYVGGNEVYLNGMVYRANWWTQNNPETNNGPTGSGKPWAVIGSCSDDQFDDASAAFFGGELIAYPNPVNNVLTVEVPYLQENATLKIAAMNGEAINEQITTGGTLSIDLTNAPSGLYFIKLITVNKVSQLKISKN